MTLLLSIYIFIVGLMLGSFYNVVALRVPEGQSIVRPPSQCPSCHHRLRVRDLVPVFSYIWSRGRCRHCKSPISAQYPLVELATGLLFLWAFLRFDFTNATIAGFVLVSLGVIVTVTDLQFMRIPNKVLLAFLPVLLIITIIFPWQGVWSSLLGAATGFGITFIIAILTKGMGMGDVKLFALLGWIVGFPNVLLAFLIACALGSFVGGILIAAGKVTRKQPIPFAPWLAAGAWMAFVYGEQIIGGYLSLIS